MMEEQDLISSIYISNLTWMDKTRMNNMDKVVWIMCGTLSIASSNCNYIDIMLNALQ